MKVYLDDERTTPKGWTRTHKVGETIELLKTGKVEVLSLDHDLGMSYSNQPYSGEGPTGYEVLVWIEKAIVYDNFIPPPDIRIHTANPAGRKRMELALFSIKRLAQG